MDGRRLSEVQQAARQVERAQLALAVAVQKAHIEGHSLRRIAKDAGVSHEQVRRIVAKDPIVPMTQDEHRELTLRRTMPADQT